MPSFTSLDPVRFKTFLQLHSPFRELETANIDWVAAQLTTATFDAEQVLTGPDQGVPPGLFVLVHGGVRVIPPDAASPGPEEGEALSSGACFPIGALSGRRPPSNAYVSTGECECLILPLERFHELLARSTEFSRYCHGYLSSLVSQSRVQLQAYFSRQVSEQQSLSVELRQLIKRQPITLPPSASLRSVLEMMGEKRIGSIIVADESARPVGIFTQSDVLRRVVLGGAVMEGPIADVMSPNPATLAETATAYDAMLAMAAKAIRHVVLVDLQGCIRGVVSERDLFALQRVSVVHVRRSIEAAANTTDLQRALTDVRQCAFNMVAQGVASEQLTRFISTENDAVTGRVLELNLARHDLAGIEWAWLAFGSEGREEQTLSTDQDNGIVFVAEADRRDSVRAKLLAFARDVNTDLDQCGFPLCKGNIMAGNPEWCLTLDEWRAKFSKWVETPQPQALLNATIFFDIRALYGRAELAAKMYAHLFALVRENGIFQRMLAGNALSVSPPLAMIRDFVTESDEHGKAFIDLKKFGARLFVDAARVMALRHAVASASTVERLRRTARLPGGSGDSVEALVDAFNFLQMLRLRHQHLEAGRGRPGDNRIFIGRLNPLERRILKESFRQAKDLQQRIKVTYQL